MRSVVDALRTESRDAMARLAPADRLHLALTLGDSDVALLSARRGIPPDDAVEAIRRTRQHGRRRSATIEGTLV